MEKQHTLRTLLLPAVALLLCVALNLYLVARFKALSFIEVPSLQSLQVQPPENISYYMEALEKQNLSGSEREKALQILRWVSQTATKVDSFRSGDPIENLTHIQSGGGAICSNLAIVLQHALATQHIPSRKIWLMRNLMDTRDVHVSVEVLLNGKWVILDPTFNLSFTNEKGDLLSAQEVHNALMKGEANSIRVKEYGREKYPLQLKEYYIHFLPLFNNVFVVEPNRGSFWYYLPKVGSVSSLTLYYEHSDPFSNDHILSFQFLSQFWSKVLPLLNIVLFGIFLIRARGIYKQRKQEPLTKAVVG